MLPFTSSSLPNNSAGTDCYSYLTLLQKGFAMPFCTKNAVSSYLTISPLPYKGGIFSAALSLSFHLPGVTWFFSVEPGLSS